MEDEEVFSSLLRRKCKIIVKWSRLALKKKKPSTAKVPFKFQFHKTFSGTREPLKKKKKKKKKERERESIVSMEETTQRIAFLGPFASFSHQVRSSHKHFQQQFNWTNSFYKQSRQHEKLLGLQHYYHHIYLSQMLLMQYNKGARIWQ